MARNARAVVVGYPHHITQRGNNREPVFLDDQDRLIYIDLLKYYTQKFQVDIWAYCLMPNHVHLLAVPQEPGALALGIGRTNQVYTRYVNRKYLRSGRVWQNRFYSCIVDNDEYLWSVARYIENNPVKAGLCLASTILSGLTTIMMAGRVSLFSQVLFFPIASPFDFNNAGMMNNPVDRGHGHQRIGKDLIPLSEGTLVTYVT